MAFLRTAASRHLRTLAQPSLAIRAAGQQQRSQLCSLTRGQSPLLSKFAFAAAATTTPKTLALVRWQSGERENVNKIDREAEKAAQQGRIKPHPELVSTESSSRGITTELGVGTAAEAAKKRGEDETDMMSGIRGDLVGLTSRHHIASRKRS